MKSSKAILLFATETKIGSAKEPAYLSTLLGAPALISIDAKRLRDIIRFHHGVPPDQSVKDLFKEGWVVWSEVINNWTFHEWYWSSTFETWRPARFQVVSKANSEDVVLKSIKDETIGDFSVVSMCLDPLALQGLAEMAIRKKKHVMAIKQGFRLFTDFEAFEAIFRSAVEQCSTS